MKLLFRLVITIFKALFAKNKICAPLAGLKLNFRVLPTDLDLFFHMNNSRFLLIMDLGRIDFAIRCGIAKVLFKKRWATPIGQASIKFNAPLKLFQKYVLVTKLVSWDEKWFYFEQQFRSDDKHNRLLGIGHVKSLMLSGNKKITPKEVITELSRENLKEKLPFDLKSLEKNATFQIDKLFKAQTSPFRPREPIAIVGIGCRLPGGANSPKKFWKNLLEGKDCIVDIPKERWDLQKFYDPSISTPGKMYMRQGGFLIEDLRGLDAKFFGISPREALTLDPQQRLLLEVSWEAFEDAFIPPSALEKSKTGVFIGGFLLDNMVHQLSAPNRDNIDNHTATSATMTMLANRLSYFYDLTGPSMAIDTACSSSLVALHQACQSLWSGETSLALAGGVNAILAPETQISMSKGQFLSPDARCKAFDQSANGYVRGEGAAIVILKPLSEALKEGNPIYSIIRSSAVNQDGKTQGITLPNADSQIAVMQKAYQKAGVKSNMISYVEAHGTGTAAGDPVEANAIGSVVGQGRSNLCITGSVKTNIGHLEAASGVAGVIKTALILKNKKVPKHLHLKKLNKKINLDNLGLEIPTKTRPLKDIGRAHFAGVNSFGYGGTNAHVVLEGPPAVKPHIDYQTKSKNFLLPISAKSTESLNLLVKNYRKKLDHNNGNLSDLCYSSARGRDHHPYRYLAAGDNNIAVLKSLNNFNTENISPMVSGRIVFVFTGMGPQWWAMGRDLILENKVFRRSIDSFDDYFKDLSGFSIKSQLLMPEKDSKINDTNISQPAICALQIALYELLKSWGVVPHHIVGHSVGEVAAACVAGALNLKDAVKVIYHRSRLQHQLEGKGSMLAVNGPSEKQIKGLIANHRVEIAARNGPESYTLAGNKNDLKKISGKLDGEGCFNRFLKVNVPYHCFEMEAIKQDLLDSLAGLTPDSVKTELYSTVTANPVLGKVHDANYWWKNIRQQVKFYEVISSLLSKGPSLFVEIGPHPVLKAQIAETAKKENVSHRSIATLVRKKNGRECMAECMRFLYQFGADIDWSAHYPRGNFIDIPTYCWDKEIYWKESKFFSEQKFNVTNRPFLMYPLGNNKWETHLNFGAFPYLFDHVVSGSSICPGAAYLEMALEINQLVNNSTCALISDVEFKRPFILSKGKNNKLYLSLDAFSTAFKLGEKSDLTSDFVCMGRILKGYESSEAIDLDGLKKRLSTQCVDEFYKRLHLLGLEYGPSFRGISTLYARGNECLANIKIPKETNDNYICHPIVIDTAFQSALGSLPFSQGKKILPTFVNSLSTFGLISGEVWCYSKVAKMEKDSVSVDLKIADASGKVLAKIDKLQCKIVENQSNKSNDMDNLLYISDWKKLDKLYPRDKKENFWVVLVDIGNGPKVALKRELSACFKDEKYLCISEGLTSKDIPKKLLDAQNYNINVLDLRARNIHVLSTNKRIQDDVSHYAQNFLSTIKQVKKLSPKKYFTITPIFSDIDVAPSYQSLILSSLNGLHQTASNENPAMGIVSIQSDETSLATIISLISQIGPETNIKIKNGQIFVNRLKHIRQSELKVKQHNHVPDNYRHTLQNAQPGQISGLGFCLSKREELGADDIEIEVNYAPLAFKDVMKAMNMISDQITKDTFLKNTIGMEGSGIVSKVGSNVTHFSPGDRVCAVCPGFFQSHVKANQNYAIHLPKSLTLEQSSNIMVYLTVYESLIQVGRLKENESVLIHGATGGVGLAAIEMAKWKGAKIFATAGTQEKRQFLRSQGVLHVSDSRSLDFVSMIKRETNNAGVDIVLNFYAGDVSFGSFEVLAPFGRFLEIGKNNFDGTATLDLRKFNSGLTYSSIDLDRILLQRPKYAKKLLEEVFDLFESKKIKPLPTTIYSAGDVQKAFYKMASFKHTGKITIDMKKNRPNPSILPSSLLDTEATYLVTGASRGFGLEVVKWLLQKKVKCVVAISRSAIKNGNLIKLSRESKENGQNLIIQSCDVSNEKSLREVFSNISNHQHCLQIKGIFHAAMVLDDKPIDKMDLASMNKVFGPKLTGAWNLHQICLENNVLLDHFVLFSSISSLIGNPLQANYVMANCFLDELAKYRSSIGLPALAINWGVFKDVGVVARGQAVSSHMEKLGINGVLTDGAIAAMETFMGQKAASIGYMDVNWTKFLKNNTNPLFSNFQCERRGENSLPPKVAQIFKKPASIQLQEITKEIIKIVSRVLDSNKVKESDQLSDLGVDSILGMEIVSSIENTCGVTIPTMEVMAGPKISKLCKLVLNHLKKTHLNSDIGPGLIGSPYQLS